MQISDPHTWTPSRQLRCGFLFLLVGLWGGQFLEWNFGWILVAGLVVLTQYLTRKMWGIFVILFLFGVLWGSFIPWMKLARDTLSTYAQETHTFEIDITSFPDTRPENVRAYARVLSADDNHSPRGKILLVLPRDNTLHYGQRYRIRGVLTRARNFEDFDYRSYLERYGVRYILRNPSDTKLLSDNHGWTVLRSAENLRELFAASLRGGIPLPHSKIALGILVGVRDALPEFLDRDFDRSGLQHLLVVSGFNVSVVLIFLGMCLRHFGRWVLFGGLMSGLIFFVCITGADPPVLRAALMGGSVSAAAFVGRMSDTRNVLLLSAVILGVVSPMMVQSDLGFQLSFAATAGIVLGMPIIEKLLSRLPNLFHLREALSLTLAAQLAVLPFLVWGFGSFPIAGVVANLFAEPIIPPAMVTSFVAGLCGWLPTEIALLIGLPAFLLIELLLVVAHVFAMIPALSIHPLWSIPFFVLWGCGFVWMQFSSWYEQQFLFAKKRSFAPKETLSDNSAR